MLKRLSGERRPAGTAGAQRRMEIGEQTIIVGDCARLSRSCRRRSVDVVVTSPPYNIGLSTAPMTMAATAANILPGSRHRAAS